MLLEWRPPPPPPASLFLLVKEKKDLERGSGGSPYGCVSWGMGVGFSNGSKPNCAFLYSYFFSRSAPLILQRHTWQHGQLVN